MRECGDKVFNIKNHFLPARNNFYDAAAAGAGIIFSPDCWREPREEPAEQNLTVNRTEEEPVSNHCVYDTFTAPEERPLRLLPSAN